MQVKLIAQKVAIVILCLLIIEAIIHGVYLINENEPTKISLNYQNINFENIEPTQPIRQLQETNQAISIPKILWSYSISSNSSFPHRSFIPKFKELYIMNHLNNIRMATLDNYTVKYVSDKNYSNYLSEESTAQIDQVIQLIHKRFHGEEEVKMYKQVLEQMVYQANNVIKRLIVYFLMKEHGGVFVDDMATVVETFQSMFSDIETNKDINTGNKFIGPENKFDGLCIAFYNDKFSSMKEKVDFLVRDFEMEKSIVKYPNIEDYFIACEKNSRFIDEVLKIYVDLLVNEKKSDWLRKLKRSEKMIGITDINKIYEHGHAISSHIVLQSHQKELQQLSPNKYLAIDSFQLKTINYRLGPGKIPSQYFSNHYKSLSYFTKLTTQQLEVFIGKLRYVFCLENQLIEFMIWKLGMNESAEQFVAEGSFADRYLLQMVKGQKNADNLKMLGEMGQKLKTYAVMKNLNDSNFKQTKNPFLLPPECPRCHHRLVMDASIPQWSTLQRNIWIIWDNGIEKSNFIVELCYQNLKLSAQNSNFTLNVVTKENVHTFISKELTTKINNAINNASFDLGNQAISDLWRLALVYQHGGVYLDASTFQVDESFEWILNVTRFPRNLIWNRYGQQPDVFMFWNSYYGGPMNWHYDNEFKTKSQWHLSYESNFIAAVKGSELLKEWLQTMIEWIQLPYSIVHNEMKAVDMLDHIWTKDSRFFDPERYLTVMDAIKYVVGKKEKYLQQNQIEGGPKTASHYFKVWSVPGQMLGQLKFRGETNYENSDYRLDSQNIQLNNIYRYKYPFSYVEGPLGPALFQVKYFGYDLINMNRYLNNFYLENHEQGKPFDLKMAQQFFHPQSLFSTRLLNRFPNKSIECIEKYSDIAEMRTKLKAANKIWTY